MARRSTNLPQLDEGARPHDGDIDLPPGRTVVVPDFETEDAQDNKEHGHPRRDELPVETDRRCAHTPCRPFEPVSCHPTCGSWCARSLRNLLRVRGDLITATRAEIVDILVAIVAVEGPILRTDLRSVYIKAAAGQRVSQQAAEVAELGCVGGGAAAAAGAAGSHSENPASSRAPAITRPATGRGSSTGTANVRAQRAPAELRPRDARDREQRRLGGPRHRVPGDDGAIWLGR